MWRGFEEWFVEENFERRHTEEIGQDGVKLGQEIGKLRTELGMEIGKLDLRITELESKLVVEIAKLKFDMFKWMLIFSIGQVGIILGILAVFFK